MLYKYSDMQTTFGVNMVAIADGKPRQLGLKDALYYFIRHQEDVVRRRTQFDLDKARAREHILQGLIIAVDQLDRGDRADTRQQEPQGRARGPDEASLTLPKFRHRRYWTCVCSA